MSSDKVREQRQEVFRKLLGDTLCELAEGEYGKFNDLMTGTQATLEDLGREYELEEPGDLVSAADMLIALKKVWRRLSRPDGWVIGEPVDVDM